MFFSMLIVLICLCLLWNLCNKSVSEPPAVSGKLPIIGHAHMLFLYDLFDVIVDTIKELQEKKVATIFVMFKKFYVVTDPEAVLIISNNCLEKENVYNFLKPFFGEGLVTNGNVSEWKSHRKFLNPAFKPSNLKSYMCVFNEQARRLMDRLDLQIGTPYAHDSLLKLSNLETICLTATGINYDECIVREQYSSLVTKMLRICDERFRRPWFHNDFIYHFSNLKKEQDVTTKQFSDLSYLIIEKKRQEMKIVEENYNNNTERYRSFLELMLDNTKETVNFTDKQIKDEMNTIISAGYETTALILNITLIVLGSYLDVQEKVYNEIMKLDDGSNKYLDTEDISKLYYTEAVLKETLRLYPTAPMISRYVDKDIKIGNYTITADSTCILNIYGLNRHPVWGPDADQFKPERWLSKETLPDMNSFGSFALGRRNCIGKTYAMMLMKVTMAHLIRRYRISADISKVRFNWHITTYPVSGNQYTLERRKIPL